jgi:hypothetical protein
MDPLKIIPVIYQNVRGQIRDGDIFCWDHTRLLHSRVIAWFERWVTRRPFATESHASVARWWGTSQLFDLGVIEGYGGHPIRLVEQVRQYPGLCHVYRHPKLHAARMAEGMGYRCGRRYGWWDIFYVTLAGFRKLLHLPRLWRLELTDQSTLDCSDSVAYESLRAGFDGETPDDWPDPPGVTPVDLAEYLAPYYQFTLFATEWQVRRFEQRQRKLREKQAMREKFPVAQ